MKTVKTLVIGAAMATATLAAPAAASVLYAANYGGPASPLFTADQTTGLLSTVGGALVSIGDLAGGGNQLFGIALGSNNALVSINRATGGITSSVTISGVRQGKITSIAYDAASNRLFGNTTQGFGGGVIDSLYEIDTATGAATYVGDVGFTNVYALAFGAGGALYGIDEPSGSLLSISTLTGVGSSIGTVITASGGQPGGLYDLASRPEDGVMYLSSSFNEALYTVDLTSAMATLVGGYGRPGNIAGLAFANAVPEPATWALMIGGLGLVGASLRRRERLGLRAAAAI